jgi:hypothetical protein
VQQNSDLCPDPEEHDEDELEWESDPDDLLDVLVDVKGQPEADES